MTWNDLTALLVGAATCLPPLIGWIYRAMARPRVRVIPGLTVDLGYTALGPIVRLTAAFAAERRDAIVDFLAMLLRHDHGREVRLVWAFLGDPPAATGETGEEAPDVPPARTAVALKIKAAAAIEKRVELHDPEFVGKARKLEAAALEQLESLQLASGGPTSRMLTSEAFATLIEHCRIGLPWEAGTYTVELEVHVLGGRPRHFKLGRVRISSAEMEQLKRNTTLVGQYYQDRFESPPRSAPEPAWAWLHPTLEGAAR